MPIVNFYNIGGAIVGLEVHMYLMAGGPIPLPQPYQPHAVVLPFTWPAAKTWRATPTVTNVAKPMLQNQWGLLATIHVPYPAPPPHPAEAAMLAVTILTGTSSPCMSSHNVASCGENVCMCLIDEYAVHLDCANPVPMPVLNAVSCPSTVVTMATLGDYIAAALTCALNMAIAFVLSKIGAKAAGPFYSKAIADAVGRRAALAVAQAVVPIVVAIAQAIADYADRAGVPGVKDYPNWGVGKAAGKAQEAADS